MAPITNPTAPPKKQNSQTRRRNKMNRAKSATNATKLQWRLTAQLNRLMKLAAKEKNLMIQLVAASYPSDANAIQTDLEDLRRENRLVQSQVTQLRHEDAALYLPYVHTPIDATAKPLPQVPKLDADQKAAIDSIHYPEWSHPRLDKEQDLGRLKFYDPQVAAPIADFWLNDAIVMEYLSMVAAATPEVFIVDSLLTTDITAGSKATATATYKKKKILSNRLILFPICINHHWTLVAWDARSKTLSHYDSLNPSAATALNNFKLYLNARAVLENQDATALYGLKENLNAYPNALKQKNAVDCGVYVCAVARCLAEDLPFTFEADKMNQLRECMLYELVAGHLLSFI